MKKGIVLLIIAGVLLALGFFTFIWAKGIYENTVKIQEETNMQWSNVQAAYQRRADLVPQLVATVKGAAENEGKILREVTQARAGIVGAKTPEDLELAGKKINTAINLAFEAYPQIRSTENFATLQSQLEGTENRINVERMRYNEAVNRYNVQVRGLVRRWVLGFLGDEDEFPKLKGFEVQSKEAEKAPEVAF